MASQKSLFASLVLNVSITALSFGADAGAPSVEKALAVVPHPQRDVDYETVKPADYPKCKVEQERKGNVSGWVVIGPSGQILRKFMNMNADGQLDQFRFYNHGIEVYREIDSNNDGKIDQYRWLNRGGSRWGIDTNQDGRIDQWKVLSAAEASKEAIRAMLAGDIPALQAVMITADDLKSLGVNQQLATRLLESASDPGKKVNDLD